MDYPKSRPMSDLMRYRHQRQLQRIKSAGAHAYRLYSRKTAMLTGTIF